MYVEYFIVMHKNRTNIYYLHYRLIAHVVKELFFVSNNLHSVYFLCVMYIILIHNCIYVLITLMYNVQSQLDAILMT